MIEIAYLIGVIALAVGMVALIRTFPKPKGWADVLADMHEPRTPEQVAKDEALYGSWMKEDPEEQIPTGQRRLTPVEADMSWMDTPEQQERSEAAFFNPGPPIGFDIPSTVGKVSEPQKAPERAQDPFQALRDAQTPISPVRGAGDLSEAIPSVTPHAVGRIHTPTGIWAVSSFRWEAIDNHPRAGRFETPGRIDLWLGEQLIYGAIPWRIVQWEFAEGEVVFWAVPL